MMLAPESSDSENEDDTLASMPKRKEWDFVFGCREDIPLNCFVSGCFGKYSKYSAGFYPTTASEVPLVIVIKVHL